MARGFIPGGRTAFDQAVTASRREGSPEELTTTMTGNFQMVHFRTGEVTTLTRARILHPLGTNPRGNVIAVIDEDTGELVCGARTPGGFLFTSGSMWELD